MRARGFTLLELLVAIAILGIIAGTLYATLFAATRAQRSARSSVEPSRAAALTLEYLRQDLDGAMRPNGVLAGAFTGSSGDGAGGADSLSFYSNANVPIADAISSDLRKVEFVVVADTTDGTSTLLRRVTTNLLPIGEATVREQVLCRKVAVLKYRYFDGSIWLDTWLSTGMGNVLPVAVEVTLEFTPQPDTEGKTPPNYRIVRTYGVPCGIASQTATDN
jgi:type II secretion system protein J